LDGALASGLKLREHWGQVSTFNNKDCLGWSGLVDYCVMARPLRMERAGAWYHVTVRGTEYDWGRNMIGVVTSESRGGTHQRLLGMIVGMIGVASIHYTFYEISLAKYGVPWPSRCELSRI